MLDSFTILVAGSAVLVLLGAVFAFLWLRDRASVWLLWWGVPLICGGAALVLYVRPNWDTDLFVITVGNAVRMAALGCLWQGLRRFQGRRLLLWPLAAVCVGWLALCFIPAFLASMAARIVVVSLVNALLCGLSVWELWRDRAEKLPSRRPAMIVFASAAILMTLRGLLAGAAPFPIGAMAVDFRGWLGFFMFLVYAHATFAGVLFISMTFERREAEQRNYARSDPLTGLMNRRAFGDFASHTNRRRAGLRTPLALLVLDIDRFKDINDAVGHEAGDDMLRLIAEVAEDNVRSTDQLFRMGGDEFCIALPETGQGDAIIVAERLRQAAAATELDAPSGPLRCTISIGIAATMHSVDVEVLLSAAVAAAAEAKARGRNRVVVAEAATLLRAQLADLAGPARRSA